MGAWELTKWEHRSDFNILLIISECFLQKRIKVSCKLYKKIAGLNYKRNLAFKKLVLSTDLFTVDYGDFSKEQLVDGRILGEGMIHLSSSNPGNEEEWIIVDLEDVYEVGYVELYNRWNYKFSQAFLDHGLCMYAMDRVKDLKVGLNETLELATKFKIGSYELCGILTEVRRAGLPMRVTCQGKKTGRYVIIQPRTINLGLGIKELEVYEEDGIRQLVDFIGCFEFYNATLTSSQSSLISCQDACEKFDDKKLVFALKRSSVNFANRWILRSALNFTSDEAVRERSREFYRKELEKANANLAKLFQWKN
ncbi:hypothetical protein HELRODRAFT_178955 [Helobdella robusta]|uniref:Uncharacterized protein n=1 Tax=Helobdella robusta TaxID=6412 RepID=T1FDY5_HELRO|nr:hypothetical protein HELRODRAFT_178955 [Helobdella robusta]ESN95774.1 hypothetical protein HELRODRAFT_178955 [Helobdella robusta]